MVVSLTHARHPGSGQASGGYAAGTKRAACSRCWGRPSLSGPVLSATAVCGARSARGRSVGGPHNTAASCRCASEASGRARARQRKRRCSLHACCPHPLGAWPQPSLASPPPPRAARARTGAVSSALAHGTLASRGPPRGARPRSCCPLAAPPAPNRVAYRGAGLKLAPPRRIGVTPSAPARAACGSCCADVRWASLAARGGAAHGAQKQAGAPSLLREEALWLRAPRAPAQVSRGLGGDTRRAAAPWSVPWLAPVAAAPACNPNASPTRGAGWISRAPGRRGARTIARQRRRWVATRTTLLRSVPPRPMAGYAAADLAVTLNSTAAIAVAR
jgi:hypothetical protein